MDENNIYINRELSWLQFNERVLEEAQDPAVPLLERLNFASIFQSNLDEFFMVRVGSLYDQMLIKPKKKDNKSNMTAQEQLEAIFYKVNELEPMKDIAYKNIMLELMEYGVEQINFRSASIEEQQYLQEYFKREIKPLVFPTIIDKKNPFPFLKNKEIYCAVQLQSKSNVKLGIIPASGQFNRVIRLSGGNRFILAEDLILHFAPSIFKNYKVVDKTLFRLTRNADITVEEGLYDQDFDFREAMEELCKKRKKLHPVRMQLSETFSQPALQFLCKKLDLDENHIFYLKTPLDLSFTGIIRDMLDKPELKFDKLVPQKSASVADNMAMMPQIKRHDILLSYPYETIKPFIQLLNEAANDSRVTEIKITLYRLAKNSMVIDALCDAAENGKQVSVLVELKARFDEENNIVWAKMLEKAGCHVIYGLVGLKTHSKITLVVRREENGIRRYVHLATGNYNDSTAKLYTDCGIFTCDERFGEDATAVFNMLSGYSEPKRWNRLIVAPIWMKDRFVKMIEREAEHAKKGEEAHIAAKMNSLCDPEIIAALYYASSCGVRIDLLIRGICCLKVGIPGISENIHVRSIVGNFLEHSRIFYFRNGGSDEIYMGSADWMPRNLDRRVEIVFPVEDEKIKKELEHVLDLEFKDNVKAHVLQPDGTYVKPDKRGKAQINSQMEFCIEATEKAALHKHEEKKSRVFIPAEPAEDIEE